MADIDEDFSKYGEEDDEPDASEDAAQPVKAAHIKEAPSTASKPKGKQKKSEAPKAYQGHPS